MDYGVNREDFTGAQEQTKVKLPSCHYLSNRDTDELSSDVIPRTTIGCKPMHHWALVTFLITRPFSAHPIALGIDQFLMLLEQYQSQPWPSQYYYMIFYFILFYFILHGLHVKGPSVKSRKMDWWQNCVSVLVKSKTTPSWPQMRKIPKIPDLFSFFYFLAHSNNCCSL